MMKENRLREFCLQMEAWGASDLFLSVERPPSRRCRGRVETIPGEGPLTWEEVREFVQGWLPPGTWERLQEERDLDLGSQLGSPRRYRLNLSFRMGVPALVVRQVPSGALSFENLHIPDVVRQLAESPRGLLLVTGATGSGKSTTMAAMLNWINGHFSKHIVTLEDPIEFVHQDAMSVVTQREIGGDSRDFQQALRHVVRQNPDVIFLGELRDFETIQTAIGAAMTGHLVVATVHTVDVEQTLERLLNYFPEGLREQVAQDFSLALQGIVSQRLLPTADGRLAPTFRNRLFIAGFAIVFLLLLNNFCVRLWPQYFIPVNLSFNMGPFSKLCPTILRGKGGMLFYPRLIFTVIGLAYFLPSEASFSMWVGPWIYCLIGGVFAAYGTEVTVVEMMPELMPREQKEAVKLVVNAMKKLGICLTTGAKMLRIEKTGSGLRAVYEVNGMEAYTDCEQVLMAAGRKTNLTGIDAQALGLALDKKNCIVVDEYQRTSLPGVYAIGDVVGGYQLAHAAYAEGEAALAHILGEDKPYGSVPVPVCTYTIPCFASVGLTTEGARAAGYDPALGFFPYEANGMALAEGAAGGVFAVIDKATQKTLGFTIVGENASEMIALAASAVADGLTAQQWERMIVAHPSLCEMVREAALDAFGMSVHKG